VYDASSAVVLDWIVAIALRAACALSGISLVLNRPTPARRLSRHTYHVLKFAVFDGCFLELGSYFRH
jgi:hypothetical protein